MKKNNWLGVNIHKNGKTLMMNDLIELAFKYNEKIELVLANDKFEGECLALKIADMKFFLAWETFEGCEAKEYLIRESEKNE